MKGLMIVLLKGNDVQVLRTENLKLKKQVKALKELVKSLSKKQ